jgi:hypothetical protein
MHEILVDNYPPMTIERLSKEVLNETAHDQEGKILIELFCLYADNNKQVPPPLINHFSKVFKSILNRDKEPKAALGILENIHPNHPSDQIKQMLAVTFAFYRMDGIKVGIAEDYVSIEFGWGRTAIREAWKKHKNDAEKMIRIFYAGKFTSTSEQKNFTKLFKSSLPEQTI